MSLAEQYQEKFRRSGELYTKASEVFPSGVTHDARFMRPFPVYVERAQGSHKWTVEGHELIDYWTGHGSLMLGHSHPDLVSAVSEQVRKGTHYGANHENELKWGQLVKELVPGAERVRFTSSGTEATLMAIRLARAFTGRKVIVKFASHFHGWHDIMTAGVHPPYDVPDSVGIPEEVFQNVRVAPPNEIDFLEKLFAEEGQKVAAVILEPTGGTWGTTPFIPGFLEQLRQLCTDHGVLLIFDEVITGFRLAPGGAQEYFNIDADLCCFAKVLAGGLPGGAVTGPKEIMDLIAYSDDPKRNRFNKFSHPGTYNANPLSAAAGIAMLEQIKGGEPSRLANAATKYLIDGLNQAFKATGVKGFAYGEGSMFHMAFGLSGYESKQDFVNWRPLMEVPFGRFGDAFRQAMLLEGVDMLPMGGWLSAVHSCEDLDRSIEAFEKTLRTLKNEGILE
ncbi:MAG: aminotransferase class III-fold pyridoxal phosphate-dependent enzyme [Firmicutes bacterium]|nr:aminotransferase class III-fold pyridoxal phosphate-dependent enzyme [Bacillota bacterium]